MSAPRYWRNEVPRYRLMGKICKACGARHFPAKPVCACGGTEFEDVKLSESGEIVTWTVIRSPPLGYERYAPYIVALIELDDGMRLLSQVVDVDPSEMKRGLRVEAVFRRVREDGPSGIIMYGYKFRPVVE